MTSPARASAPAHTFQLYLYRRPLHPELFPLKARRTLAHGPYELEAWIIPHGHVLRFRTGLFTCCELVTGQDESVPVDGAVTGLPCTNEHEFAHRFEHEKVHYLTNAQLETLSPNLYRMTHDDMLDYVKQTDSLAHKWTDSMGRNHLSVLDLQKLGKEVHCQSFHLVPGGGLVLRTQTIFECV